MSNNPAKYEVLNKNTCLQYPGRKLGKQATDDCSNGNLAPGAFVTLVHEGNEGSGNYAVAPSIPLRISFDLLKRAKPEAS